MEQITLNLQPKIANRFDRYINLFGSEEIMFDKFLSYHENRIKREISRMQNALIKYEEKYEMKTSEFHKLFDKGKLGDAKDYMLWAGIYELQLDSKQKLSQLL